MVILFFVFCLNSKPPAHPPNQPSSPSADQKPQKPNRKKNIPVHYIKQDVFQLSKKYRSTK